MNSSDDKLIRDIQKLDISSTIVSEPNMEVICEDDTVVPPAGSETSEAVCNLYLTSNSRRQGAETAPAYGIVSENELALKRCVKLSFCCSLERTKIH